ncbi:hypothetical protein, partial [Micromonospora sp. NPDC048839]|uniref:hypothetical protein n=1 Tax=Micromonospora sp. NPDC048839 TaxID=3155641 RepID=UPI0033F5CC4B
TTTPRHHDTTTPRHHRTTTPPHQHHPHDTDRWPAPATRGAGQRRSRLLGVRGWGAWRLPGVSGG